MFQSLEAKGQPRELQKAAKKTDKFLSGDSKHRNMPGSIHEKDHRDPDKRFVNTDHLRYEYGDNHIWDVPIQRQPIIQMYHRMPEPYGEGKIIWCKGEKTKFWNTVDDGLYKAKEQLRKGIEVQKIQPEDPPVSDYAKSVFDRLNSEDLEIYPMTGGGRLGQSECGKNKISLGVNRLINKKDETAKTLIHEAFHIIGGCWKIDGDKYVYDEELDIACDEKDNDLIYDREFKGKDLLSTKADAFAQYIMNLQ